MSASFYDLLKYAKTGVASPEMTSYDKQKALAMCKAGFPVKTLTGVPPITFQSDGTPLTAWSISGNMEQSSVPTPTVPITPEECGDLVETGEHAGEYAVPITLAGQTYTIYLPEPLRKIGDYADSVSSDGTVVRRIKKLVFDGTEEWGADRTDNFYSPVISDAARNSLVICSHQTSTSTSLISENCFISSTGRFNITTTAVEHTTTAWKTYLAQQYAAGTPVCVWYVLATTQTETVTVPTLTPTKGSNTLSIGTTLQPSEVSITGGIKE